MKRGTPLPATYLYSVHKRWLTRSIFILSLVSLLNDAASELLYPVLPIYLAGIGFGAMWIGLIEGVAEATAGLSKGWFGKWSDMRGERLPFIRFGYFLSSLAKPLIVLFPNIFWAVFMRSADRLGKGVRTGARDAMLAHQSTPENRGKVYGFHRMMDTIGAFIGPSLALWWLIANRGANIADIFYLALIPAALSLVALMFLKDNKTSPALPGKLPGLKHTFNYWKEAPAEFRKVAGGFLLFALCNSSDLFLLLALKEVHDGSNHVYLGFSFTPDETVILFYILYNFVYAAFALPAGYLSDKINPRTMFILGIVFYSLTYGGFSLLTSGNSVDHQLLSVVLMCMYGIFGAVNDGISKAWLSVIVPKNEKGAALGFFAGASSISLLFASLVAGAVWTLTSAPVLFGATAVLTFFVICYMVFFTRKPAIGKE